MIQHPNRFVSFFSCQGEPFNVVAIEKIGDRKERQIWDRIRVQQSECKRTNRRR